MAMNGTIDSSADTVTKLVAELGETAKGYTGIHDSRRKNDIRAKAQEIMAATQDPDTQWEDHLVQWAELGVIKEFVHLKVFDKIPAEGEISYQEIAEQTRADVRIITRMANVLVATNVLRFCGVDRVAHTPLSKVYMNKHPTGLMSSILFDEMGVPCSKWPYYFDEHGLQEPGSLFDLCPHTYSWGQPEKNSWEIMSANPERISDFNLGMSLLEHVQPCLGMYDYAWLGEYAQNGSDKERKLLVDVGGGRGTTLQVIINSTPAITASRCVLHERPDVVEQVKGLDEPIIRDIEKIPLDFHKDTPVQGEAKCLRGVVQTS